MNHFDPRHKFHCKTHTQVKISSTISGVVLKSNSGSVTDSNEFTATSEEKYVKPDIFDENRNDDECDLAAAVSM